MDARCPFRRVCAFFRNEMEFMPGTAGLYRHRYCRRGSAQCARFRLYQALGAEAVPHDLFPYDEDRADSILSTPSRARA